MGGWMSGTYRVSSLSLSFFLWYCVQAELADRVARKGEFVAIIYSKQNCLKKKNNRSNILCS